MVSHFTQIQLTIILITFYTRAMYVCLCNAVTESEVVEACDRGANSLPDLQEELGVALGCGQCADTCCAMLEGKDALAAMPGTGNATGEFVNGGIITRA